VGDLSESDPERAAAKTNPERDHEPGLAEAGLLEHTIPHAASRVHKSVCVQKHGRHVVRKEQFQMT